MANYGSRYRQDANFNEGQPLVGPTFKATPAILGSTENVTVDKWFQSQANPIRKVLPIAAVAASFFFVPVVTQAENITVDKWYQPISQPVIAKKIQQPSGEFRFEVPRTVLITDWFQAASEPVRRKPTQLLGGDVRVDLENITIDKWGQPISQPYFSKRRDPYTGEFRFEVPRTVLISDWFQQASEPVRAKIRQLLSGESRTDIVTAAEVVTMDKWYNQTSQPYFSKRRDPFTGEFRFEVPRTVLLSDWFQPASEPVRRKTILLSGGDVRIDLENLTLDKWGQPISQPYFTKRRDPNTGEFRYELPRNILVSDWFQPASEPVRRKFIQIPGGDARVEIENITLDKWGQPTGQPYFTKRRDPYTGEYRYELPRNILLSDWFQQASEPVRSKIRQLLGGEFRTDIVTIEIITIDKWLSQYPDIINRRSIPQTAGETRVDFTSDIPVLLTPAQYINIEKGGTGDDKLDRAIQDEEEVMMIIQMFLKFPQ